MSKTDQKFAVGEQVLFKGTGVKAVVAEVINLHGKWRYRLHGHGGLFYAEAQLSKV